MQQENATQENATANLIITLNEDVQRCHKSLVDSMGPVDEQGKVRADGFHARQYIRAVFAYIEGITFIIKIKAASKCLEENKEISPPERYFVAEVGYELNDKGEVVERRAHLRLAANMRFAFLLYERAHDFTLSL